MGNTLSVRTAALLGVAACASSPRRIKGRQPFPNAAGKDTNVRAKGRKPLNAERGILEKGRKT